MRAWDFCTTEEMGKCWVLSPGGWLPTWNTYRIRPHWQLETWHGLVSCNSLLPIVGDDLNLKRYSRLLLPDWCYWYHFFLNLILTSEPVSVFCCHQYESWVAQGRTCSQNCSCAPEQLSKLASPRLPDWTAHYLPRVGSGVVRTDPLRFLTRCRKSRLNQA